MPIINPDIHPDNLRGMSPSRFDHCLVYGDDLDGTVKLFTEVPGFSVTEKIVAGPERFMIGCFAAAPPSRWRLNHGSRDAIRIHPHDRRPRCAAEEGGD